MDISEIRAKYNLGDYSYKVDIPRKVSADHVFDEELSVKRNRELAVEFNSNVDHLKKLEREEQMKLERKLTDDVVNYIIENYYLSENQARKVERFVYQEHHSYMCDYFSYIDTYAEFTSDILNCGEGA